MRLFVKLNVFLSILLGATLALAQVPPEQNLNARLVIGLDNVKHNAGGFLTTANGVMVFKTKKAETKVPASSISDIFVGTETTQSGGTPARLVKLAAPFGSGRALTLLLRTKVDILTVVFKGPGGELHAAIFAIPKGQAEAMRAQLVAAGAHTAAPATELKERSK